MITFWKEAVETLLIRCGDPASLYYNSFHCHPSVYTWQLWETHAHLFHNPSIQPLAITLIFFWGGRTKAAAGPRGHWARGGVRPGRGGQSITWLTHRHKQPFTLIFTPTGRFKVASKPSSQFEPKTFDCEATVLTGEI